MTLKQQLEEILAKHGAWRENLSAEHFDADEATYALIKLFKEEIKRIVGKDEAEAFVTKAPAKKNTTGKVATYTFEKHNAYDIRTRNKLRAEIRKKLEEI